MRSRVKTTKESLKANREQLNDLADTVRVSGVIQNKGKAFDFLLMSRRHPKQVRTITEFDTVHRYEMQEKFKKFH